MHVCYIYIYICMYVYIDVCMYVATIYKYYAYIYVYIFDIRSNLNKYLNVKYILNLKVKCYCRLGFNQL